MKAEDFDAWNSQTQFVVEGLPLKVTEDKNQKDTLVPKHGASTECESVSCHPIVLCVILGERVVCIHPRNVSVIYSNVRGSGSS